jgi:hypothetical protein
MRDPYIREKFTREISHARKLALGILRAVPQGLFETEGRGHHRGAWSPGDDSHSLIRDAVSACRALRIAASRNGP